MAEKNVLPETLHGADSGGLVPGLDCLLNAVGDQISFEFKVVMALQIHPEFRLDGKESPEAQGRSLKLRRTVLFFALKNAIL